jgi:hypothetical protein
MANCCFCAIATRSHFKYAAALASSLQRHYPTFKLKVLLIDFAGERSFRPQPSIDVHRLDELQITDIDHMKIYFNAFELSNCLKPFFVAYLLRKGFDKVVYLDADILAVNDFGDLFAMLDHYDFVLSPHWLQPELAQNSDFSAHHIFDLGIYNGGMWGARQTAGAIEVMEWLMRLLPRFGFDDRQNGLFVDQKVLPLAAQLFRSQFGCLEHPGYNVGYWNLHERKITRSGDRYLVNGQPAVFFHLSGFRMEHSDIFSRHSSWTFERLPILKEIVAEYMSFVPPDAVDKSGYLYDHVGGQPLSPELRRYYFIHRTLDGYAKERPRSRVRRLLGSLLNGG